MSLKRTQNRNWSTRRDFKLQRLIEHMDARVKTAIRIMGDRLASDLSTSDLSKNVNLSATRLRQLFQREVGQSPSQYFRDLRLKRAQELLEGTFYSIKEVRFHCGLSDPSHFTRSFKRRYGQTPTEFRISSTNPERWRK